MKLFIVLNVILNLFHFAFAIDTYQAKSLTLNKPKSSVSNDPASLMGAWQTRVPGGVWTTPSAFPGWSTLHVSAGAISGLLVIYSDGSYVWNAYGGKKGKWFKQDRSGYPIALEDKSENRTWNVGMDQYNPGKIYIWDGKAFTYQGARPK